VENTSMPVTRVRRLSMLVVLCAGIGLAEAQDYAAYTGAQLYAQFCASCHGAQGHGDGPVAPTLKVEVPDLTRLVRRPGEAFPTEQVRRIVDGREVLAAHGARRMPVWGYEFATATVSEPEAGAEAAAALVDRLVAYVATLQRQPAVPVPIAPPPPPRPRTPG
jgi:mono/diheme cytochrome c family protein